MKNFNLFSTPPQENIHFFQPGVFALVWLIYPGKVKKRESGREKTSLWIYCGIKPKPHKVKAYKITSVHFIKFEFFFFFLHYTNFQSSSLSFKQKMKRVWMELNWVQNLMSSYYFFNVCSKCLKFNVKFCRQKWSIVYCHTKFLNTWIHIKRTREKTLSNSAVFCWRTHQISVINLNMSGIWAGNSKFSTTQISTEMTVNVTAL